MQLQGLPVGLQLQATGPSQRLMESTEILGGETGEIYSQAGKLLSSWSQETNSLEEQREFLWLHPSKQINVFLGEWAC